MSSYELKGCPFCGHRVIPFKINLLMIPSHHFKCTNPECDADMIFDGVEADCVKRYNSRGVKVTGLSDDGWIDFNPHAGGIRKAAGSSDTPLILDELITKCMIGEEHLDQAEYEAVGSLLIELKKRREAD